MDQLLYSYCSLDFNRKFKPMFKKKLKLELKLLAWLCLFTGSPFRWAARGKYYRVVD